MHLTEQSYVVKSTTAACSQKYQLIGNFLNKYTNRYMQWYYCEWMLRTGI